MQFCYGPATEMVGVLVNLQCLTSMGFAEWDLLEVEDGLLRTGHELGRNYSFFYYPSGSPQL